jgi:hypothetical protein
MVFTGPVSGKVVGCLVTHNLGADLELLDAGLVEIRLYSLHRMHTFLCASTFASGADMFALLRLVCVSFGGEQLPRTFLTEGAPRPHGARASKK